MKNKLLFFTLHSSLFTLAAQAQQRPNIVYIMTDDHTEQMMSCYGRSPIQTPNLDRIAQEGVRFTFAASTTRAPASVKSWRPVKTAPWRFCQHDSKFSL